MMGVLGFPLQFWAQSLHRMNRERSFLSQNKQNSKSRCEFFSPYSSTFYSNESVVNIENISISVLLYRFDYSFWSQNKFISLFFWNCDKSNVDKCLNYLLSVEIMIKSIKLLNSTHFHISCRAIATHKKTLV